MSKDPKFGWHVYWIAPLFIIGSAIGTVLSKFKRAKKEVTWTPEQKRLQVLAGIRKEERMSEAKFVQELPLNPEKGQSFWVSQGKPGFWIYMTYTGQDWVAGASIACPHIPKGFE